MEKGIVHAIQRYNLHDGPGVRTLVFLQGCPLRCKWCANPDTQRREPFEVWRYELCLHCGLCALAGAGEAHALCPSGAKQTVGRSMTAREVLCQVLRDRPFYAGQGGVTLSGGEPLMQWRFAAEILDMARAEGVRTAVETSGYAPREALLYLARRADLMLYDIKHMDPTEHRRLTGVDNGLILDNLQLAANATQVIARLPIIGGANDALRLASDTARFLRRAGVTRAELLPYHTYGVFKYALIGRAYDFEAYTPDKETLEALARIYVREGVDAQVLDV